MFLCTSIDYGKQTPCLAPVGVGFDDPAAHEKVIVSLAWDENSELCCPRGRGSATPTGRPAAPASFSQMEHYFEKLQT